MTVKEIRKEASRIRSLRKHGMSFDGDLRARRLYYDILTEIVVRNMSGEPPVKFMKLAAAVVNEELEDW